MAKNIMKTTIALLKLYANILHATTADNDKRT